ncbi:carbohydrate kinase [Thalassobacter stenotrophicus]|uniref:carbohydrate kinase family protein n=1 Tax=Thalassobacter TaxID=266808 RepID=UPI00051D90A3|nr:MULTISPECIES: carbohydrate kinase [Thalassobacter]KGK80204.1 carbohydrate kinase [Thalassobacter stenotrophicus]KGL01166.1 carbohydrate kinase [Thalassobacter sp. 16PALIMAR09]
MILCAGEALIDMLPRQTALGEATFMPCTGGAALNMAVALARLDTPVSLFTGLSTDMFGNQLRATLAAAGVGARAATSDRPTTLAFVELVDGSARYAFFDENTAGRMLTADDLPALDDVQAVALGGISLAVEPCADAFETLCTRAAPNKLVMIDPNIRPLFISDEARYRARLTRMMAVADIVKLSDEDLDWWNGGDIDALLASGPKMLVMTKGPEGAVAIRASGMVSVPATRVDVVDTIGAGDTFNAGFMAGLSDANALSKAALATLSDDTLRNALTLGVQAAGITVSRAGANPPHRSEL